jgi:RNase P subunit RPR2
MKILYLDIETAPTLVYSWSLWPKYIDPNNIQEAGYTLCWAAQWEGEREVMYGSIKDGEQACIDEVYNLLDAADAVVHYNGSKFDIPILQKEFVRLGKSPPSHFHQIDLLKTVRKQFRFESNKLDYVCQRLGLGQKVVHKGMALWFGVMEGNEADWKTMERYNKRDVKILRKLYKHLLPWIHNHPTVTMWANPTRPACTNCGSQNVHKKGTQYNTKSASYDRYKCNKCGTPMRSRLRSNSSNPNVLTRTN